MTLQELRGQFPPIIRNRTAIIKVETIYSMTVSGFLRPQLWQMCKYFEEEFMLFVIPQRTKPDIYGELFDLLEAFVDNWEVL